MVESEVLERELGISVLPAPGDSGPAEAPVLVILHGMGEDHLALDRHGVSGQLREAMLADLEPVFGDGDDPEFARRHDPYRLVLDRPAHLEQKIFLAAGEREWSKFERLSVDFHEFLEAREVEHRIEIYDGGHGWRDWLPAIEHAIAYFVKSDE